MHLKNVFSYYRMCSLTIALCVATRHTLNRHTRARCICFLIFSFFVSLLRRRTRDMRDLSSLFFFFSFFSFSESLLRRHTGATRGAAHCLVLPFILNLISFFLSISFFHLIFFVIQSEVVLTCFVCSLALCWLVFCALFFLSISFFHLIFFSHFFVVLSCFVCSLVLCCLVFCIYIYVYIYIYTHTHTHTHCVLTCFVLACVLRPATFLIHQIQSEVQLILDEKAELEVCNSSLMIEYFTHQSGDPKQKKKKRLS